MSEDDSGRNWLKTAIGIVVVIAVFAGYKNYNKSARSSEVRQAIEARIVVMNSDVLYFNRLFRFIPGIRYITRAFARFDNWCTGLPGLRRAGLQVVGKAVKPMRVD